MVAVQWNRGFQRLAMLASSIVVVLGIVLAALGGMTSGGFLFLFGLAALPWVIFFVGRWLVRGFAAGGPPNGERKG